jgi:hypothetical protein
MGHRVVRLQLPIMTLELKKLPISYRAEWSDVDWSEW